MSSELFRVELIRGQTKESEHLIAAVMVDADGQLLKAFGNPEMSFTPRSALKPIQALPFVMSKAYLLTPEPQASVAIACASHLGQPVHIEFLKNLFSTRDLDPEKSLVCGPLAPLDTQAFEKLLRADQKIQRIHHNCSGKHAGFLCVAQQEHLSITDYGLYDHPLQARVREIGSQVSGFDWGALPWGYDGCGVPTYFFTLLSFAQSFSRFLEVSQTKTELGFAAKIILEAMTKHPELVGGAGGLDTALMRDTHGRLVVKVGAEGSYLVLNQALRKVVCLKCLDGAKRAADVALLDLLLAWEFLALDEYQNLKSQFGSLVQNSRGDMVGKFQTVLTQS